MSTYFKVRPRIYKALQGFALLMVLVATLAVMLKYMGDPDGHSTETWLDCACVSHAIFTIHITKCHTFESELLFY